MSKKITAERPFRDLERTRAWLLTGQQLDEFRPLPPQSNGNGHASGHQDAKVPAVTLKPQQDRAGAWLRAAGIALSGLAAAAAAVSYEAQFKLIDKFKHEHVVSYIQAGIPDIGSLVFACLGIALALHGKRAIRARFLNVACVGISIAMNAIAAAAGWHATAVWVMAPVIYALASDTLIGVLRAYAIARHKDLNRTLAADDTTPLQVIGTVLLWLLRLVMDPPGTVRGFRSWVLSTPASPPQRPVVVQAKVIPPKAPKVPKAINPGPREGSKTARMITLAEAERDLKTIPVNEVSRLATVKGAEAGLDGGAARAALLKHVRQLQNGEKS